LVVAMESDKYASAYGTNPGGIVRYNLSTRQQDLTVRNSTQASSVPAIAAQPFANVVNGTPSADQITLSRDLDGTSIDWTMGASSGQLPIADPNGLTINGAGSNDILTLDYAHGNPLPYTVHLNGTFTISGMQGSNPLAGTTLEIGRSTVYVSYAGPATDPVASMKAYLANGYAAGAWNGVPVASTGVIMSLAAKNNPLHNTGIGWADFGDGTNVNTVPNTIELKYTLNGDATLDGKVDIFDLNALLAHYNLPGSWTGGDSTYNGQVDIFDLNGLLPNYNANLGSQAVMAAAQSPSSASASFAARKTTATKSAAVIASRGKRGTAVATLTSAPLSVTTPVVDDNATLRSLAAAGLEYTVPYKGGLLAAFKAGGVYFSADGTHLDGSARPDGTSPTVRVTTNFPVVTAIAPYRNGILTAFADGGVYFSPTGGLGGNTLDGAGATKRVTVSGTDVVRALVPYQHGVLAAFASGGVYYSPTGGLSGNTLDGAGLSRRVTAGFPVATAMAAYGNGILTAFATGGVYFSPSGGLGGNTLDGALGTRRVTVGGTDAVTVLIPYHGGVLAAFASGGVYYSPTGGLSGNTLDGAGSSRRVTAGFPVAIAMVPCNNGILTTFEGGAVYFSPSGGLGGNTLDGAGSSSFIYAPPPPPVPMPPPPTLPPAGPTVDYAGNTLATARDIGILTTVQYFNDWVGPGDSWDFYKFVAGQSGTLRVYVQNLTYGGGLTVSGSGVTLAVTDATTGTWLASNSNDPGRIAWWELEPWRASRYVEYQVTAGTTYQVHVMQALGWGGSGTTYDLEMYIN
ncbi:MAG TPA: hypothetical protein DDY78_23245, partial [Planctomycetales bacterium]|nr:hypothetical protein [Planctomycetales bacterium]